MHPPANTRLFEEKYLRFQSEAGARFRAASGGSVPNGWTTVEQAEWMAATVGLAPGERLLDLGAGRGWPGELIAQHTGAQLLSVDVPIEALRQGRARMREALGARVWQVCGDGRALPIGDGHFSAVCHTDVLC
ncbi:MAG: class I SAM-dependent methyltransferase [Longimicrobiales bacterium]|nr:class I SAM-dependent methyltransferase [Longimicrobiales bacterium]